MWYRHGDVTDGNGESATADILEAIDVYCYI